MVVTGSRDTIYALSSGAGKAAVAVVRVSGSHAAGVLRALCGDLPVSRVAAIRPIRSTITGQVQDKALVLYFEGPRSFTGEDCAELHLHGSPGVVRLVLDELRGFENLRPAEPGEFTRRAFENGKLDLVEVEGLADVLDAGTGHQVRQALYQADGEASRIFESWRRQIVRSLALVEACIDFSDEEGVEAQAHDEIAEGIGELCDAVSRELAGFERGRRIREGVTVVLAGAPNAGKSSLMNMLAARDVAIVSEEAGTTRDVIGVGLDLAGHAVDLLDTAGIRENIDSKAEQIGVSRTIERASEADLVLLVGSHDAVWPENFRLDSETIRIWNKADVRQHPAPPIADISVSAETGEGLDGLLRLLTERVRVLCDSNEPAVLVRERQVHAVENCLKHLKASANEGLELEIVAEELRLAASSLERLIGRIDVEDLLDDIFSRFCIGK